MAVHSEHTRNGKFQMGAGIECRTPADVSNNEKYFYNHHLRHYVQYLKKHIQVQIWRIETTLNINNVFDVQYEDVEDVTLPGRWIRFSLRYNL